MNWFWNNRLIQRIGGRPLKPRPQRRFDSADKSGGIWKDYSTSQFLNAVWCGRLPWWVYKSSLYDDFFRAGAEERERIHQRMREQVYRPSGFEWLWQGIRIPADITVDDLQKASEYRERWVDRARAWWAWLTGG